MRPDFGRRHLLAGFGIAAGAALLRPALAADTRLLTATDVHVSDYPTVEAVRWIGQQLEAETAGRLSLRIYYSGQLGRENDQIDMARHGAIDITRVYSGALNNGWPRTIALGLPYLIRSKAHLRALIDGEVGARVLECFEARGLVGLAIYDCGARSIYNTQGPLRTPADLVGMKLRVPPSDIFLDLMRELGANPTPLPFGEVFSALETRLIDGAENNVRSFHSSRQFELARFWSETQHSYAPDVLLMSKRNFDQLSADDQALLRELARRSVAVMRERWDAGETRAREAIAAAGVEINTVDIEAFRAAAAPIVARYRAHPEVAPLVEQIEAETQA
ncbi:MAG: TRAP transporter substrate-binding protein [Xanthomonadales bacterium]|nr:TRAP transporter substrate-binding protein [Xanthomonadales bacterium]